MVREYNKNDIDAIIELCKLHHDVSVSEETEKRKELEGNGKALVYEQGGIIYGVCIYAFWINQELGSCAEVIFYTRCDGQFSVIANSLWDAVGAQLKEKEVVYLITEYNQNDVHWKDFFTEKQFEQWIVAHIMIYKGQRFNPSQLSFRHYNEDDFELYNTYLSDCFYELRRANDVRPHNTFKSASKEKLNRLKNELLELKDCIYLFYEGEQWIGSALIKDGEIDDVFVLPLLHGKGYGRKIMESIINIAFENKMENIRLDVLDWNKKAIKLYKSLGFEIFQSIEHRRIFYNPKNSQI